MLAYTATHALQLGGLQLERDVRAIVGFLTSSTDTPVRDKFARVFQMCTVLSIDSVSTQLPVSTALATFRALLTALPA